MEVYYCIAFLKGWAVSHSLVRPQFPRHKPPAVARELPVRKVQAAGHAFDSQHAVQLRLPLPRPCEM